MSSLSPFTNMHSSPDLPRAVRRFCPGPSRRAAPYRARHKNNTFSCPVPAGRSGYDGAQFSRLIGNWFPGGLDFNALITQSGPNLRARVRDLVRNFPPFARAVNGIVAFTVGKGARFQSLAFDAAGNPDLKLRQRLETDFRDWMEQADVSGEHHFYEMQQLVVRQKMESGESIILFTTPRRLRRGELALQMFESEALESWQWNGQEEDTDIFGGIEYDIHTGERVAYHFQTDLGMSARQATWREPAENVLHIYNELRPGQMRGVSPFAPAIIVARDMGDYTGAEIDSAKLAAKWLAMIKTPTPEMFQGARAPGIVGGGGGSGPERDDIDWLENAIIEYLREGEDIVFAPNSGRPGDSFDRFNRFALRMVGISIDLPYEILSGDYTNINYSTSKASRNDFAMFLAPHHFGLEHHFIRKVYRRWLAHAALSKDYLRGYFVNPRRFERAMWIPAGMPSVDPLRDGKAIIDMIAAGLESPQAAILARGGDPEEVLAQIADWRRQLNELGLDINVSLVDTSLQNNPAKLGAEEELSEEDAQKAAGF